MYMRMAGEGGSQKTALQQQVIQMQQAKKLATQAQDFQEMALAKQHSFLTRLVTFGLIGLAVVGIGVVMYAKSQPKRKRAR